MSNDKLSQATEHDIEVHENGDISYRRNYCTDYGKAHGGYAQLTLLVAIAQAVAFIGIWPLAWWLGSTSLTTTTKGALSISYLVAVLICDVVMVFRYIKLRFALIGIAMLLGLLVFAAGVLALIVWGASQFL